MVKTVRLNIAPLMGAPARRDEIGPQRKERSFSDFTEGDCYAMSSGIAHCSAVVEVVADFLFWF